MKLSVVILNYNVEHFLHLCLDSVKKAISGLEAEVIVVDNNSSDGSCEMVRKKFPEFYLIPNTENIGFARANNLGVQSAKGEYLCILNPDTVVGENSFRRLLDFISEKENPGAVGCRLIDGRGRYLPESKRNIPTPKVALKKLAGYGSAYYDSGIGIKENGAVQILVGAMMFMKRELYLEIGGFDEDYFMYGEDIDLCYRLMKSGYTNYYYGELSIIHFKGESTVKDSAYAERFYGAMKLFYSKHFKRNFIIDTLSSLSIAMIKRLRKPNENHPERNRKVNYLYLGNEIPESVGQAMDNEVKLVETIEKVPAGSHIILDANHMPYSEIIACTELADLRDFYVRIRPGNTMFIVGSDRSEGRGTVLILN